MQLSEHMLWIYNCPGDIEEQTFVVLCSHLLSDNYLLRATEEHS